MCVSVCVCELWPPGVYLVVCPLISHVLFALKFLRLIGLWRGRASVQRGGGEGGTVAAAANAH